MAFKYHDILAIGDIHIPHDLEFSNQPTRLAGGGLGSQHVGRLCKQLDDSSYWVLTQFTPSIEWAPFVPPEPVVGDIGSTLSVVSDGASGVRLDWTGDASVTLNDAYDNSGGASNINVDAGDVTWSPIGAYSFNIDLSSISGTVDGFLVENGTDNFRVKTGGVNQINLSASLETCGLTANVGMSIISTTSDVSFSARGGAITLNQTGDTTLSGFTATSIVGALNELKTGVTGTTLDQAYNNDGGAASITVDAGDVTWSPTGAYSFNIDLVNATGTSDGFRVLNGTDDFEIKRLAADTMSVVGNISTLNFACSSSIILTSTFSCSIDSSELNLNSTPKVTTAAAQNLNLVPGAGGITQIGDAGSTSHGIADNDSLFVSGQFEVDGTTYFDGTVLIVDNVPISIGDSSDGRIEYSTSQTAHALMMGVSADSNALIIAEKADITANYNFGHAQQTNPTIFLHSASQSTTEYGSMAHDQTDFVINQGAGTTKLAGGMTLNVTTVNAATYDLLISDHIVHVTYTVTAAVTSLTLPTAQTLAGRTIHIKDAGGNAATNNITVDTGGSETIDGSATLVLNQDYMSRALYSDGSNWFIY
jgi:hypothetical protein